MAKSHHPVYKTTKPLVTFLGTDAAYLIWTQYNADPGKILPLSHGVQDHAKENNEWKIVNVSAFWNVEPQIPAIRQLTERSFI